jgi:Tol biopolymer transport system component
MFIFMFLSFAFCVHSAFAEEASQLSFACQSQQQKRTKIVIQSFAKKKDPFISSVAKIVAKDLSLTSYFDTHFSEFKASTSPEKSLNQLDDSIDFVVQVSPHKSNLSWFEKWFKTEQEAAEVVVLFASDHSIIQKYTVPKAMPEKVRITHQVADALLSTLVGATGCFDSSLAWCEKETLFLSDPLGVVTRPLLKTKTKVFAPTWHPFEPVIFYSRSTTNRHVLESLNLKSGVIRTCSAQKGLNMQLAYNTHGDKSVMVVSCGKGNSELFLSERDPETECQVMHPLTHNGGTNVAPTFLPNGDLLFCSDFQTRLPQLYYFFMKAKKMVRLTDGSGYCAAPSYCAAKNSVVFTKPKNGIFQLFMISLDKYQGVGYPKEVQLTFDRGNKTDPVWHPSGNLIACAYEFIAPSKKKEMQIALVQPRTGALHVVTHGGGPKGFPAWIDKSWWFLKG